MGDIYDVWRSDRLRCHDVRTIQYYSSFHYRNKICTLGGDCCGQFISFLPMGEEHFIIKQIYNKLSIRESDYAKMSAGHFGAITCTKKNNSHS
jgi:hypothetical protein